MFFNLTSRRFASRVFFDLAVNGRSGKYILYLYIISFTSLLILYSSWSYDFQAV